ncbi:UNVERIFIED_CONTAM: hypothetical protein FKN15_058983 [Acipenser sinensis]
MMTRSLSCLSSDTGGGSEVTACQVLSCLYCWSPHVRPQQVSYSVPEAMQFNLYHLTDKPAPDSFLSFVHQAGIFPGKDLPSIPSKDFRLTSAVLHSTTTPSRGRCGAGQNNPSKTEWQRRRSWGSWGRTKQPQQDRVAEEEIMGIVGQDKTTPARQSGRGGDHGDRGAGQNNPSKTEWQRRRSWGSWGRTKQPQQDRVAEEEIMGIVGQDKTTPARQSGRGGDHGDRGAGQNNPSKTEWQRRRSWGSWGRTKQPQQDRVAEEEIMGIVGQDKTTPARQSGRGGDHGDRGAGQNNPSKTEWQRRRSWGSWGRTKQPQQDRVAEEEIMGIVGQDKTTPARQSGRGGDHGDRGAGQNNPSKTEWQRRRSWGSVSVFSFYYIYLAGD